MQLTTTTWAPSNPTHSAVCLHGITGSSASWWRVAEHMTGQGFTVTAPDLRGHGNSPRPMTGYTFDELVDDVVDTVGPHPDLLIGHSFGGTLALRGIAAGTLTPRVTVLEDPVLQLTRPHAARVAEAEINWVPPAVETLADDQPRWLPRDLAGRILAHYQMDPAAVTRAWTDNAPWNLQPSINGAAAATRLQIIVPAPSPYVDGRLLDRLLRSLGHDAVLEVPGSGHSVHRDAFDTFVSTIDRWCAA